MDVIRRGKVANGVIVFAEPLGLPEGTEVEVRISPVPVAAPSTTPAGAEDFLSQPFFGMYKDREDMRDSVAWVQRERAKWHQRSQRSD